MNKNILRNSDVVSIYLLYINGASRNKLKANLRFMDTKECYLTTEMSPNFVKPKKNHPATLMVYTSDGVYKSDVKILDANLTGMEIMYTINLPATWNYTQLRTSSRKKAEIPFTIKFNDGYEISSKTYDIAIGGISFYIEQPIPELYTRFAGVLTITLPAFSDYIPAKELSLEAKYVRTHSDKDNPHDSRYVFKFLGMSEDVILALKQLIIALD